jgi:uncharacterized OB-fold protein
MTTYFRATDPFPLESAEQNKLHEFYARLAEGRLVTTACLGCRRRSWPPRGFCPECAGDRFEWVDLPREGRVHAVTVQETGVPSAFTAPRVFAIVLVEDARIFAPILGPAATSAKVGSRAKLSPLRVADDATGLPRYLVAFELAEAPA